jgi:type II secretory pathway component PulM
MMDRRKFLELFETIKLRMFERIGNTNLTDRDRRLLTSLGFFLILIIIYLVIFSFGSAVDKLESKAVKLEQDVLKVKELKTEYIRSSQNLKKLLKSSKRRSTPLISEVEKILLNENVDRKYFSIRDRQTRNQNGEEIYDERAVDVEIKNVPLDKMINILYAVQSRPSNLKISGLRLRTRFDNSNSIDIYFRVSTFEFKEVA